MIVVALPVIGVVMTYFLGLATWERHTGYFSPAFSLDGRAVYAIVRETSGFVVGFGWHNISPPAYSYTVSDRIALVRVDVGTGSVQRLERWASTPIVGRVHEEYRGGPFGVMRVVLRPSANGLVRYGVEMRLRAIPSGEFHALIGVWADNPTLRTRAEWQPTSAEAGVSEPVLDGETEVLALSGPESFPCAIVLFDHHAMMPRILIAAPAYARTYPAGPSREALLPLSRKQNVDRVAEFTRVRQEREAYHRARGLGQVEAMVQAYHDLEDLGYLPRTPRLIAFPRAVNDTPASGVPLFEIPEGEMDSGIFPDLREALAAPGTEVRKARGPYSLHRDYTTSGPLNDFLARGGRQFFVRFKGDTYRVEIR